MVQRTSDNVHGSLSIRTSAGSKTFQIMTVVSIENIFMRHYMTLLEGLGLHAHLEKIHTSPSGYLGFIQPVTYLTSIYIQYASMNTYGISSKMSAVTCRLYTISG